MKRDGWALVSLVFLVGPAGCIPDVDPKTGTAPVSAADAKKCPPDGVIDDGEDNNNQVAPNKGRSGYWYTFLDKAGSTITPAAGGTFTMAKGGANGSAYAANIAGKVGTGQIVFAGMGFNFLDPKSPYDASEYRGIVFWARAAAPTKARVKIPSGDTDPDGKVCTECFNDFGMDIDLTPTWTKYNVAFAATTQLGGWGAPHPASLNTKKLYGVQFQVNSPGTSYDIWVDELEFTGCP